MEIQGKGEISIINWEYSMPNFLRFFHNNKLVLVYKNILHSQQA